MPTAMKLKQLEKHLRKQTAKAISDFNMIEEFDRVMVCLSGGKDSYAMLNILLTLQKKAPVRFDIIAMNLDQKQPGFPAEILPNYLNSIGVEYRIVEQDTYSIVQDKLAIGKTTCSLCSRLRRGVIYRTASELGATKIALGHHSDDIVETFFLNLFFGGKLKSMPAKLINDKQDHIIIRPLAYCAEKDIVEFAKMMDFPIIPCNLCGSQVNLQRKIIKDMLIAWEKEYPGRSKIILRSLQNSEPSHLLDNKLYNFCNLETKSIKQYPPEFG